MNLTQEQKDEILLKIAKIEDEKRQALAHANGCEGALQVLRELLAPTPPKPEPPKP